MLAAFYIYCILDFIMQAIKINFFKKFFQEDCQSA